MLDTALAFDVYVVDGEGMPVPWTEVGARYRYPKLPKTWSTECTDGDGYAHFRDEHKEEPTEVCLFVGDQECGTHALVAGAEYVLEM